MEILLNGANIVVVARNYNPSIASKDWLLDKEIITEQPTNFINSPPFSLFESQNFLLTVDESKLEVGLRIVNRSNIEALVQIVTRYVEVLPHTPYKAVGLNFFWKAREPEGKGLIGLLKQKFLPESETKQFYNSLKGSAFPGSIIRYIEDEFLIRLVVEPIPIMSNNSVITKELTCSFNYHSVVKDVEDLKARVAKFSDKCHHSKSTLSTLFG